jgi:preprotein translocase subunit SecA
MGVKHEVLNAKHHEREAKIIAQAGRPGNVTVATNMAGRGVDIILGGAPFEKANSEKVVKAGGLHVLGTERHEARRIDNQLRGRSGRQGDPGTSQFYVSMDDDLIRIFGGDRMKNLMGTLRLPDDVPIEHSLISRSIESAQKKVEGHNFDIRKHLVEYDDVANKHRQAIYSKRRKILEGGDVHQEIVDLMDDEARKEYEEKYNKVGKEVMDNVERMVYLRSIDTIWIEHLNAMDLLREGIGLRGYGQRDPLVEYKAEAYALFQRLLGNINAQVVEILLKADIQPQPRKLAVEQPARNIQMRGADEQMAAGTFGNVSNGSGGEPLTAENPTPQRSEVLNQVQKPTGSGVEVTVRKRGESRPTTSSGGIFPKVGRNEPCPCGSGKKYKKCHGR